MRVFLFFSSFYGLTDVKTEGAHKFRVSKGNCGLRHAKKCQCQRVILVVSNCLFVLLSRSRCYRRVRVFGERSRRVALLTRVGG